MSRPVTTLGDRLRFERERRGWSQEQLAGMLTDHVNSALPPGAKRRKVTRSRISEWETNDRRPLRGTLIALAYLFEIDAQTLLDTQRLTESRILSIGVDNRYLEAYNRVLRLHDPQALDIFVKITLLLSNFAVLALRKRADRSDDDPR